MFHESLHNQWGEVLHEEFTKPYFRILQEFLVKEYAEQTVYPAKEELFSALNYTDYNDVKVLILGQDPYHGPGQAHGLSFSVKPGVKIPPSLRNIFKELQTDVGASPPSNGHLTKWAEQGVLLLNTVLTVREGEANSHKGQGWEQLTDRVIIELNSREQPVIFLLWGRPAQAKLKLIDRRKHIILTSPHPSPLSACRGFFGSKPFSKINSYLREQGETEIDWKLI